MKHAIIVMSLAGGLALGAADNLVTNGGFEEDVKTWSYEEYKGLPLPGRIETDGAPEGAKYFVFTEPGNLQKRFIRTNAFKVEPGKDYVMTFQLAGENLPEKSIEVQLLQYEPVVDKKSKVIGWASAGRPGVTDFLAGKAAGTFGWQEFTYQIPASAIDPKTDRIAIYFQNKNPGIGELKIDAVSFAVKE